MKITIRKRALLGAILVAAGFAKDVTQPVKKGALELGAGFGYAESMGRYNARGGFLNRKEAGDSNELAPAAYGIPLSVKYGLGEGFDLKANWAMVRWNKEAGNLEGTSQPSLVVKYTRSWGGFLTTLTFPFATGDFNKPNLPTIVEIGGFVRKRLPHFRFLGLASYWSVNPGSDLLRLQAQPEILWEKKTGTYLSLEYFKALNKNADLSTLSLGTRGDFSSALSWDVVGGVSVAGHNAPAAWGLKTTLLWTLLR